MIPKAPKIYTQRPLKPKLTSFSSHTVSPPTMKIEKLAIVQHGGERVLEIHPGQIPVTHRDLIHATQRDFVVLNGKFVKSHDLISATQELFKSLPPLPTPPSSPSPSTIMTKKRRSSDLEDSGKDVRPSKKRYKEKPPPRPRNCWIIYRSEMHPKFKTIFSDSTIGDISKIVGAMWRNLPESVRQEYSEMAKADTAKHREKHPDYKYAPRKPNSRKMTRHPGTATAFSPGIPYIAQNEDTFDIPDSTTEPVNPQNPQNPQNPINDILVECVDTGTYLTVLGTQYSFLSSLLDYQPYSNAVDMGCESFHYDCAGYP
ncbi:hypothetical protein BC937DRAFT_89967 [Endogone sp. FLAS-F59071]|nr:hypothetical protein BC937DRAFT_89967 [Endogone sp. FLAS-F59071]|eukprot:RUS17445.1 hypothetical protein BC937DRAFT_89967 [Endogone sp. FLAS-F59071]